MVSLCIASTAPLRTEPRHSAELSSQIRLGEPVWIIEDLGDWVRVETAHLYQGFARAAHFQVPESGDWSQKSLLRATRTFQEEQNGVLFPVPEGGFRWENTDSGQPSEYWEAVPEKPEWDATRMMTGGLALRGVPYVWGGKTTAGMDCSGLIQFLLEAQGFSFPRDAWQQEEKGLVVDGDLVESAQPGDLYFFRQPRKKVHHVALALGAGKMLHASEWVRVESLREQDPDYAPDRHDTLYSVRRLSTAALQPLVAAFREMF